MQFSLMLVFLITNKYLGQLEILPVSSKEKWFKLQCKNLFLHNGNMKIEYITEYGSVSVCKHFLYFYCARNKYMMFICTYLLFVSPFIGHLYDIVDPKFWLQDETKS